MVNWDIETPSQNDFIVDEYKVLDYSYASGKKELKRACKDAKKSGEISKDEFKICKAMAKAERDYFEEMAPPQSAAAPEDSSTRSSSAPVVTTPEKEESGMPMAAKVGIGVGVLAVLGIGIYFIAKK